MKWFIVILLALVPLPFGSARAEWQWFWMLYIAITGLFFAIFVSRNGKINKPQTTTSLGSLLFAAFIGWCFLQAVEIPGLDIISIEPFQSIKLGCLFLAHGLFFYICYSQCTRHPDQIVGLLKAFAIITVIYSLYGFFSFVLDGKHILWYPKTAYKSSVTGSFVNANNFAAYTGMGLLTSFGLLLAWLQRAMSPSRSSSAVERNSWVRAVIKEGWLYMAGAFFCATALLMTGSRAGIISVMAGLLLTLILWMKTEGRRTARSFAWVLGTTSIFILLFWLSGDYFSVRLEKAVLEDQRFDVYPAILDAILERPFTGFGIGAFETAFRPFRPEDVTLFFDRAHSEYLELAMTAGLPASALFFAGFFFLVAKPLLSSPQRTSASASAKFIAAGVMMQLALHATVDFPLQIPAISLSATFLFAISLAATKKSSHAQHRYN